MNDPRNAMQSAVAVEEVLPRTELFRRLPWTPEGSPSWEPLVEREWLVTNGTGGYASGTILGIPTRRYHGLLIAASPSPLGRFFMLGDLRERVMLANGDVVALGGQITDSDVDAEGAHWLAEFRLEFGLPVWTYDIRGTVLERRVLLPYMQNTCAVRYRLIEARDPITLELRPTLHFRSHDDAVDKPASGEYTVRALEEGLEIAHRDLRPCLRMRAPQPFVFHQQPALIAQLRYRLEERRGYAYLGPMWTPGTISLHIDPGSDRTVIASTEPWDAVPQPEFDPLLDAELRRRARLLALAHPALHEGVGAELTLAADQFIFASHRRTDEARARAEGEEARSIIAGFHWFTDWGRDTMISLEGLTLVTGRRREAGQILRTFGRHMRDGLIPNMFPEGQNEGLYHTADATLWFFHAVDRYIAITGDSRILEDLLPLLRESIDCHVRGTRFGIGVDPADGLLRQGAPGYQLTWMDAKVDDWVVTPRRGKAVEINALWYNALRLMERWENEAGDQQAARRAGELAMRAHESFNRRFWIESRGHLFDVVDGEHGDDPTFRPNQVFAISLPHPVLRDERWEQVVSAVSRKLLTPVGLRSLAPDEPDYKPVYFGDLRARDAAYHQGTVWAWLIGPFVDAWLRVYPDDTRGARALLDGLIAHLDDFCIGNLAEIFDGEPPNRPRGCVAQAWSVAEVLRSLVKTTEPAR